jgi:antitoxin VapB
MALNIKNAAVERLAAEVAAMAKGTEIQAIREDVVRWLREEYWPSLPPEVRGNSISQEEQDEILGYGPNGV